MKPNKPRRLDGELVWTFSLSFVAHATLLFLFLAGPNRYLNAAPPPLESYTVELIAPDAIGGNDGPVGPLGESLPEAGAAPGDEANAPVVEEEPAQAIEVPLTEVVDQPEIEPLEAEPPVAQEAEIAEVADEEPQAAPEPEEPVAPEPETEEVAEAAEPEVEEAADVAEPEVEEAADVPEPEVEEVAEAVEPPVPEVVVEDAAAREEEPTTEQDPPAKDAKAKAEPKPPVEVAKAEAKPKPPAQPAKAKPKPPEPTPVAKPDPAAERDRRIAEAIGRRAAQTGGAASVDDRIAAAVRRRAERVGGGGGSGGPLSTGPGSGGGGGTVIGAEYVLYKRRMEVRIREAWVWAGSDDSLQAVVRFGISADGDVENVRTTRSSGDKAYDASAERAVEAASPLGLVPSGYRREFADVEMTFRAKDLR